VIGQLLANGIILGATIALGAIGLTMTYNILDFANFAQGELLTFGAYFALIAVSAFAGVHSTFGALSFGWPMVVALLLAAALTSLLAILVDWLVFRPLRRSSIQVALVIASFGASLLLRHLVVLIWGPQPAYYTTNIQISTQILPGVRVTPDQIFLVALTALLVVGLHFFLSRTKLGKAMRATADDPQLAQVTGIDVARVVRWTWIVGGSLAAVAGVLYGMTVQILPEMGFNLILPLFAAAILGGVGSVYGAVLGGLVIGIAENLSVLFLTPTYKPAIAFLLMIAVLLVRPTGILGKPKL
jgi:branched-chain amino acid transport system permease protein